MLQLPLCYLYTVATLVWLVSVNSSGHSFIETGRVSEMFCVCVFLPAYKRIRERRSKGLLLPADVCQREAVRDSDVVERV